LGYGFNGGNAYFKIPADARKNYADGVYDEATGLVKFRNCCWFTNLDTKKTIKEKPLLPGYVLVEANLCDECYPRLRNVPNVLGFLSVTKDMKPAPVRPADINKLFGKIEEVDELSQLEEAYLVGEKVKVIEGPFNGFTGTIEEVQADKKKLKVIVVIFDRQTPLELAFNQVEKE
jgi:transcriptional antiterminator NusG